MTLDGKKIKMIPKKTEYYFGPKSAEEAIDPNDYEEIGNISNMKSNLKPGTVSFKRSSGTYLGQDLTWWKENTKTIFDESIFDFSPDADAKALVCKFRSICNATTKERRRRTRQGKKGKKNYG